MAPRATGRPSTRWLPPPARHAAADTYPPQSRDLAQYSQALLHRVKGTRTGDNGGRAARQPARLQVRAVAKCGGLRAGSRLRRPTGAHRLTIYVAAQLAKSPASCSSGGFARHRCVNSATPPSRQGSPRRTGGCAAACVRQVRGQRVRRCVASPKRPIIWSQQRCSACSPVCRATAERAACLESTQ